jgi:hypothetical protein
LLGTSLETNPFDRKKEFTRIQDIFAKIINTEVTSESGLFYGGDESPQVHDSRTKVAATQLIKHACSPNEVRYSNNSISYLNMICLPHMLFSSDATPYKLRKS